MKSVLTCSWILCLPVLFKVSHAWIDFQKTLSSLELPGAVSLACGPSNISGGDSILNENHDSYVNDGSSSVLQHHGRPRNKIHDPARDLSIQVLEKFSLVTKFARETTSHLFREHHSNGYDANDRRTHNQAPAPLDHLKKSSSVAGKDTFERPVVSDSEVIPVFMQICYILSSAYSICCKIF